MADLKPAEPGWDDDQQASRRCVLCFCRHRRTFDPRDLDVLLSRTCADSAMGKSLAVAMSRKIATKSS